MQQSMAKAEVLTIIGINMSPEQKRQIEDARRESIEKSKDVCADGEKNKSEYDHYSNEINE